MLMDAHEKVIKSGSMYCNPLARAEDLGTPSSTSGYTLPLDPHAVCRTLWHKEIRLWRDPVLSSERTGNSLC